MLGLSLLLCLNLTAQNETAFWYFGENAGLNFNSGFPNTDLNGALVTTEGCSTISSRQGQLLFYSDGSTVWDKTHNIMQNGTGLMGDESATQSAIIIPKPGSIALYYIFTVDDRAGSAGLRYTEVNLGLNGGLGAVTANKNVLLESPTTEKITAIESADGESIWVISHKWNSNEYIAYLVSSAGINMTPVISPVGSLHQGDINNTIGYLKASPDRAKIASVKSYNNSETQIFDFNAATGILSNPITISNYSSSNIGAYGCEFSPDSRLLYVTEIIGETEISRIHQYNLTLPSPQQIINSDVIIAEEPGMLGALQQALDGKIYVAKFGATAIGAINAPNTLGLASDYSPGTVFLGGNVSRLGLPPFVQSYFFATNIFNNTCFGETTEFSIDTSIPVDSILWDFGDPASGASNTSTSLSPTHVFSAAGSYEITITLVIQGETQLVYRSLTISDQPPVLSLIDLTACEQPDGSSVFDLTSVIPLNILNDPDYVLSFYTNPTDASDRINAILSPNFYATSLSTENIFVRLESSLAGDCFSLSDFNIITKEAPIVEAFEAVSFCVNIDTSINIDVGPLDLPYSNYSFLWLNTNETTAQIEVSVPNEYTVRISETSTISAENPQGCYAERIVQVSNSGIASINAIETTGTSVQIDVSGLGDYEFTLDDAFGVYQDSNFLSPIVPGVHTVYVRDKNGCGLVSANFSIIDFPKYFTPNGDNINDNWQVKGVSSSFLPNSIIYIFDRYGKLITQIKASDKGWNGALNGIPLPANDYWFFVTLEDGRIFKNHFTLKR